MLLLYKSFVVTCWTTDESEIRIRGAQIFCGNHNKCAYCISCNPTTIIFLVNIVITNLKKNQLNFIFEPKVNINGSH